MANRSEDLSESNSDAEMNQGARSAEGVSPAQTGLVDRLLNGPALSDPPYLTAQTAGQKARRILFMASPILLLSAAGLLVITLLIPKSTNAPKLLIGAELTTKTLPGFDKHFELDSNRDLEVTGVHFEHTGGSTMVGNIHNKSGRRISLAVVVFELADPSNSALGAVTVTELDLAPGVNRTFKKPIEQTKAMSALVREVDTR
jgi:hypothetical protein